MKKIKLKPVCNETSYFLATNEERYSYFKKHSYILRYLG